MGYSRQRNEKWTLVRVISALTLALIVVLLSTSCQSNESTDQQTTFLWQVQSEHNTVYLLGSVHVLSQGDHPLPEAMEDVFDDVDALVFEIDLDSAETDEAQGLVLSRAIGSDPNALQTTLSSDAYDQVVQATSELGLDIRQLGRFEPWFVAMCIHQLKMEQLGFESEYGVDEHFYNKAQQAGKDILALETLEYQIDLFDQLSAADQEMLLLEMFSEVQVYEAEFESMIDAWKRGDAETLEDMMLASFEDYPELYTKLVTERNDNWLPQIEGFLEENDDYLVIVGALHLVGADGLIALLQTEGYSVEQM